MPSRDLGFRVTVILVWLVITGLTLALLAGHGPWSGREFLRITHSHGVNTGDVPVIVGWLLGSLACGVLWRSRR